MSLRLGWLAEVLGDSPTLKLSSQAKALIQAGEPVQVVGIAGVRLRVARVEPEEKEQENRGGT